MPCSRDVAGNGFRPEDVTAPAVNGGLIIDAGLAAAIAGGGSDVLVQSRTVVRSRSETMISVDAIQEGLSRGEFFLEYLPTVNLADERCVGAEALARWRRPS